MSNGPQNKIRTLPPASTKAGQGAKDALDRLRKLDEWTEEPVKDALDALTPPKPAEAPQSAQTTTGVGEGASTQVATVGDHPTTPWAVVIDRTRSATKPLNFKIPEELYLRLKWLSETTYGETMTSIIISALEEKTAEMLKSRGVI